MITATASATAAAAVAASSRTEAPNPANDANPTQARTSMDGARVCFENATYTVTVSDDDTVSVLNRCSGEQYLAWGPPQLWADGGHVFDFWGTTTLQLEDGTKLTIHTSPWADDPLVTVSDKVTITNADYGVEVLGMASLTSGGLRYLETLRYGWLLDAVVADGNVIVENPAGAGFVGEFGPTQAAWLQPQVVAPMADAAQAVAAMEANVQADMQAVVLAAAVADLQAVEVLEALAVLQSFEAFESLESIEAPPDAPAAECALPAAPPQAVALAASPAASVAVTWQQVDQAYINATDLARLGPMAGERGKAFLDLNCLLAITFIGAYRGPQAYRFSEPDDYPTRAADPERPRPERQDEAAQALRLHRVGPRVVWSVGAANAAPACGSGDGLKGLRELPLAASLQPVFQRHQGTP